MSLCRTNKIGHPKRSRLALPLQPIENKQNPPALNPIGRHPHAIVEVAKGGYHAACASGAVHLKQNQCARTREQSSWSGSICAITYRGIKALCEIGFVRPIYTHQPMPVSNDGRRNRGTHLRQPLPFVSSSLLALFGQNRNTPRINHLQPQGRRSGNKSRSLKVDRQN